MIRARKRAVASVANNGLSAMLGQFSNQLFHERKRRVVKSYFISSPGACIKVDKILEAPQHPVPGNFDRGTQSIKRGHAGDADRNERGANFPVPAPAQKKQTIQSGKRLDADSGREEQRGYEIALPHKEYEAEQAEQ